MGSQVMLATALAIFGILFAQTKTTDHTPDLIIWSIVAVMLVTALPLCWLKRRDIGRSADGWFIAIAAQLVLVIGAITDLLKHLHSP